jgi:hypothetical membrane protein
MSSSRPSIDPANPLKCVDSVVLEPSATIFSTTVFVIGLTTAASAYFIHKTLGGKIVAILLIVTGFGAIGVGVFPGNAGLAHGIFAMTTFYAGGLAVVASYRILKENRPMQYLSIALGSAALIILLSLFMPNGSPFVKALGNGGAERRSAYAIVLWLEMFGGYLLAVSSLAKPKEVIQR